MNSQNTAATSFLVEYCYETPEQIKAFQQNVSLMRWMCAGHMDNVPINRQDAAWLLDRRTQWGMNFPNVARVLLQVQMQQNSAASAEAYDETTTTTKTLWEAFLFDAEAVKGRLVGDSRYHSERILFKQISILGHVSQNCVLLEKMRNATLYEEYEPFYMAYEQSLRALMMDTAIVMRLNAYVQSIGFMLGTILR
jgi:hypothetical protein